MNISTNELEIAVKSYNDYCFSESSELLMQLLEACKILQDEPELQTSQLVILNYLLKDFVKSDIECGYHVPLKCLDYLGIKHELPHPANYL